MQIQQIIYFQTVAEKMSMNKAAEELYITQSNLSYAIKGLEKELGIKLLLRSNKGVSLTAEGKKFLEYSSVIINQLRLIERMSTDDNKYNLTICSHPMTINAEFMGKFYESLKEEERNDFRITFIEERLDCIIDRVSRMEAELGIVTYNNTQAKEFKLQLKKHDLEFQELGKTTWYVVVGRNNPFYNKKSLSISDLKQFPFIRPKDDYFSQLTEYFQVDGVSLQLNKLIFCNDSHTKEYMILETDACTFIPGWSRDEYENKGAHVLELENFNIEITVGWIKRRREDLSEGALKYLNIVMNYFDN